MSIADIPTDSARNTALVVELPLAEIIPSLNNPRKRLDQEALAQLAESIRQYGLMEPIVVRPVTTPYGEQRWEIIAGERRYHACKMAGMETAPARILEGIDDARALRLALIENLEREDLDPIEEAQGFAALNRIVGLTQAEIAAAINRSQPVIANRMRLLELPEDVQERVRRGELSPAHGIALCRYKAWPALCERIAELAAANGWPAKRLEAGIGSGYGTGQIGGDLLGNVVVRVDHTADHDKLRAAGITLWGDGYYTYTPDVGAYEAAKQRLAKEAEMAAARAVEKVLQKSRERGGENTVPDVSTLPYDGYERVYREPEGCSTECPCRAVARSGKELVQICTDPKRYRRLGTTAQRAAKKELRDEAKRKAAELDALLEEAPVLDQNGLAIVVADRLWQWPKPVARRLITQFAAEVLDPKVVDSWEGRRDTYDRLAKLPPESLIRMLIHGALLDDVSRYQQYGTLAGRLVWYMDQAGRPVLDVTMSNSDLKHRIAQAKAKLQEPGLMNQPKLYGEWRSTLQQLEDELAARTGAAS